MGFFSKFEDRMEDTVEGAASKISKAPISPVQIAKKAEKEMRRQAMVGAGREYAPTLYTVLVNPDDDSRLFGYYPTLAGEIETRLAATAANNGQVMDGQPLVRFVVDDGLRHGKFDVIAEMVAAPIVAQLRAEEMARYGIAAAPQAQQPQQVAYQQPAQQPVQQPAQYQEAYPAQSAAPAQAQGGEFGSWQPGYQQAPQQQAAAQSAYEAPGAQDAWGESYGYESFLAPEPEPAPKPAKKPPLPYVPEEEIDRSIDYGEYTFNSEDFEDYREKAEADDEDFSHPSFEYAQAQPQQQVAPNTVAFAGGDAASGAQPNRREVKASLIDLTYHRPYDLAGTFITMGRETANDIVVQDINASRKHAELRLNTQGIWVITDLSSTNGTLVNGVSVASHPLYPGDVITIGKTDFRFEVSR